MKLSFPQYGTLDPNDALDLSHPLNHKRNVLLATLSGKTVHRMWDLGPNRTNGTLNSTTNFSCVSPLGIFKAIEHDGTSTTYANCVPRNAVALNQPYSYSTWFRTTSSSYMVLSSLYVQFGGITQIELGINGGSTTAGYLSFQPSTASGTGNKINANIGAALYNGTWHHVVVTSSGSQVSLYYDGKLVAGPTTKFFPTDTPNNFRVGQQPSTGVYFTGQTWSASYWTRQLSDSEVWQEYDTSRRDYCAPNSPLKWGRGRRWFIATPPATFTGTASLMADATTITTSGTHTVPTYTGTAALAADTITLVATGTHTAPVYTGTATLTTEATEIAASGTYTIPTFTATATLSTDETTLAGSGTHTAPVYTATASLSTDAAELATSGTHTAPTFTATATLTTEVAELTASGTFAAPVYTATAALSTDEATTTTSGTFTAPTYTATATLTSEAAELAASGAFTSPVYAATASLNLDPATLAATGTFAMPTFTAAVALNTDSVTIAASGTYTPLTSPNVIVSGSDRGRVLAGERSSRLFTGSDRERVFVGDDDGRLLTGADRGRTI